MGRGCRRMGEIECRGGEGGMGLGEWEEVAYVAVGVRAVRYGPSNIDV